MNAGTITQPDNHQSCQPMMAANWITATAYVQSQRQSQLALAADRPPDS